MLLSLIASTAFGDNIYVIGTGHEGISSAVNNLNALGQTVVNSPDTLSDYSAYDQVWDMRFESDSTPAQRAALALYLQEGGRVFMSGENQNYDLRNNSINTFLTEIGAGAAGFTGSTATVLDQTLTDAGQVLNTPNSIASLTVFYGRTVTAPSTGFLVSELTTSPGTGSMIGWDFGDLPNSPDSRMLIGFDVETFQYGGTAWTENVVTYLGASSVPEPGAVTLLTLSTLGVFLRRRRKKALT